MSKTLGSILLVTAAIAVNVIPGIGQAISGTLLALTGSTALAGAATLAVTAAGVTAAGGLLGLGPSAGKPETTVTTVRSPRPPRVSAYGISRLYGAISLPCNSDGVIDIGAIGG